MQEPKTNQLKEKLEAERKLIEELLKDMKAISTDAHNMKITLARVGKTSYNRTKPRPLRVTFSNPKEKEDILAKCKNAEAMSWSR